MSSSTTGNIFRHAVHLKLSSRYAFCPIAPSFTYWKNDFMGEPPASKARHQVLGV